MRVKRTREQQVSDGKIIARWLCSEINRGHNPTVRQACLQHFTNKKTLLRTVDAFIEDQPSDMKAEVATVKNWRNIHRANKKDRLAAAKLVREVIENPDEWGELSFEDIAEAMTTNSDAVQRWYRLEGPDRPMPESRHSPELMVMRYAFQMGALDIAARLEAERRELVAHRTERVHERLNEIRASI